MCARTAPRAMLSQRYPDSCSHEESGLTVNSKLETYDPRSAAPQDQGAVATFISSLQYGTHPGGDSGAEADLRRSLQYLGRSEAYIASAVQYGRQQAKAYPSI